MSYHLETMPECAGSMQPIESWVKKRLTCEDCAWEEYCIDNFDSQEKPRVEYDYPTDIEIEEQDPQTA